MDVKPEEMLGHLARSKGRAPAGLETKALREPGAPPADGAEGAGGAPDPERDAILASISASYFHLRRGLALLAFAFPIVLWLGAAPDQLQASISAYYHFSDEGGAPAPWGGGEMRDVFVGVLWAVGAFLVLYKGYSWKEDWALNAAGVAAVLIALFPMDWPYEAGSATNTVHFASAVTYFLAIAYVCLFRSGDTLAILDDEKARRRFKRSYAALGILMVVLPLGAFALHLLADELRLIAEGADETRVVLWIEVAAIWVFAAFWLVKSREIAAIEREKPLLP